MPPVRSGYCSLLKQRQQVDVNYKVVFFFFILLYRVSICRRDVCSLPYKTYSFHCFNIRVHYLCRKRVELEEQNSLSLQYFARLFKQNQKSRNSLKIHMPLKESSGFIVQTTSESVPIHFDSFLSIYLKENTHTLS